VDDDEENDIMVRMVHLLDAQGYIEIDKVWDYLCGVAH
jgi:hypothetical protein